MRIWTYLFLKEIIYAVIFKDDSDIRIDTEDVQFWKFRHRVLEELVVWASLFVAKATSITFLTSLCLSLSMSLTVLWILFILKSIPINILICLTKSIGSFNKKLDIYISSLVGQYLQLKLLAKTTKMFGNPEVIFFKRTFS